MSSREVRCRLRPIALEMALTEDGTTSGDVLDQNIAKLRQQLAESQQQVQKLALEQKNILNVAIAKQLETIHETLMVLQTLAITGAATSSVEIEMAMERLMERTTEKQIEAFKEIDPDKPGLQQLQQRIFQDRELNKNSLALDEKADKEIEDELERD